jgi:hypothetical protein
LTADEHVVAWIAERPVIVENVARKITG